MCDEKIDIQQFEEFIKNNRKKIIQQCEKNVIRNSEGKIVIPKDDPWREEGYYVNYHEPKGIVVFGQDYIN